MERSVLIAGGGVAGLALGLRLRQLGMDPLILEKRLHRGPVLRGEFFQPQGLLALDRLGILNSFRQATSAIELRTVSHHYPDPLTGGRRQAVFTYPAYGPVQYGLGILHDDILRVLLREYSVLGGEIVEDEISDLEMDVSAVRVQTRQGRSLRSRFFVGADGRFSPSRKMLKLPLLELPLRRMMAASLVQGLNVPKNEFYTEELKDGLLYAFSYPNGEARAYICHSNEPSGLTKSDRSEFLTRVLETSLIAQRGRVRLVEPWMFMPSNDQMLLTRFHSRAYWLGDAAGTVDPLGGAGMSLAIEDVLRLAEVLHAVDLERPLDKSLFRRIESVSRREYLQARYVGQWIALMFMGSPLWLRLMKSRALQAFRMDPEKSRELMDIFSGVVRAPMTIQEVAHLLGLVPKELKVNIDSISWLRRFDTVQEALLTTPPKYWTARWTSVSSALF